MEDLEKAIRGIIAEELRKKENEPLPKFLNVDEVCAVLQITPPTLRKLVNLGRIKAIKVGERQLLFNEVELLQSIQQGEVKKYQHLNGKECRHE